MQDTPTNQTEHSAKQLPELFDLLTPHLAALDAFLHEQVAQFEPEIRKHVEYSIQSGGKRIRPSLIFFSGWTDTGEISEDLVKLAAVVETVHLATLVHDDIMDGADLRRNRATVAHAYGSATAVLLGDALFSHAVYLATQFPTTEVCRQIARSTRQVCTGEILQTMQRGDPSISLETYFRVIDMKTAELFRVACLLGARLGGFNDEHVEASGAFGRHLGIAYQMYDDLTDLFGTQEAIGKTLGTDIATGKPTLPIILMRDRLEKGERQLLCDTLSGKIDADLPYWLDRLQQMGIFEEVRQAIYDEIKKGQAAISLHRKHQSFRYLDTISSLLRNQVASL